MYKIYTKGNYFVINDIQKNEFFYGLKKDVIVDKSNINKGNYRFFNVKDWKHERSLNITDLQKENGDFYSITEFDTFYTENTGNFNGGGLTPQILDALQNANSPDATNVFATLNDLGVTTLDSVVVNTDGTLTINYNGGSSITTVKSVLDIKYNVENYTELLSVTGQNLYDFAYVREQQGTSWLPGSLGGTYYGAGLYMWDGVLWVESKTNIYNELNNILNSKSDKHQTEYNVKNIAELIALHTPNINNEIQLDNAVYKIDSTNFNATGYKLIGHVNGTTIAGYSQNINTLFSTEDNITLISTSGNLFVKHINITISGTNSRAIDMNGATGSEALDMFYTTFINCTELGHLNNIRQVFWSAGFSVGCQKGFLCQGVWSNGIKLVDSRIVNMSNYIFKGDTGFTCRNIRSNVNATIPTGSYAFNFDYNNIIDDSGYQIINGYFDGGGVMIAPFTTGDTTATQNSRKSYFKDNKGGGGTIAFRNTYIGAEWICSSEVVTPLTQNIETKILGGVTYTNEVHFYHSTNNSFVYSPTIPKYIDISGNIYLVGGQNDIVEIIIKQWDDSASAYIELQRIRRIIVSSPSGEDTAEYSILTTALMSQNDRIEAHVVNLTDNSSIKMILTSKLQLREK